jgi:F-type H+-transporting ATPase subunit alpha
MAEISMKELSHELRAAIDELKAAGTTQDTGVVIRVGDGICWIYGLSKAGYNEMLEIEATDGSRITAFALNLMQDEIGAVILGEDTKIKAGSKVHLTGKVLEIPVGPELVGRVVNPLGQAIDGGAPIKSKHVGLIEQEAPGVLDRKSVHEPVMTGIVAVDALVPIGRGQRELIIGDRQTGKTAIAVDAMINQAKQKTGIINVYVASWSEECQGCSTC